MQAKCRNIEEQTQILSELEQGVGFVECNRLVEGLMRKALFAQAQAIEARQIAAFKIEHARLRANLGELLDDMGEGDAYGEPGEIGQLTFHKSADGDTRVQAFGT